VVRDEDKDMVPLKNKCVSYIFCASDDSVWFYLKLRAVIPKMVKSAGSERVNDLSTTIVLPSDLDSSLNSGDGKVVFLQIVTDSSPVSPAMFKTHSSFYLAHQVSPPQRTSKMTPQERLQQHQAQSPKSHMLSMSPLKSAGPHRKPRSEVRKCRKVYGMDNRDQWCTQCKWKKACTRFLDWSGKETLIVEQYSP